MLHLRAAALGCFFSLLVLLPSLAGPARADIDVQLLGAGSASLLRDGAALSTRDGIGIGYGAMLQRRYSRAGSFRIGGLVLERKTGSGTYPVRKSLFAPVIFGQKLFRGVRLELGGYYDYAIESTAASMKRSTFGALGGLAVDVPLVGGVGLLLGAHYSAQLGTLAADGATDLKYSDLLMTAGIRLGTN